MATTVACVEPETAPKSVQAVAVETASPPLRCPTKAITRSTSRPADCPRVMMSAAKMNIGTAISEAGRMPAMSCWTSVSICPKPPKSVTNPTLAAAISGIIMGNPSSSRTIIRENRPSAI